MDLDPESYIVVSPEKNQMDEDDNIVEDGEIDESNTSIDHQEHYSIDMDMDMDDNIIEYTSEPESEIISPTKPDEDFNQSDKNVNLSIESIHDNVEEDQQEEHQDEDTAEYEVEEEEEEEIITDDVEMQSSVPSKIQNVIKPSTSSAVKITQQKIAPKPPTITKVNNNGKIVLIQKQVGNSSQPIRIASASKAGQTIATGNGYQLIKTSDGSIIQVRNNKQKPLVVNSPKIFQPTSTGPGQTGKLIYKGITVSGNNQQQIHLLTAPTKTNISSFSTAGNSSQSTKTITVSQATQMGLLQSGKIKQMMKVNPTRTTHIQTIKMPPKILPAPASSVATTISKFKALGTNITQKIMVPQNKTTILNKSAGSSSGVAQKSFIKINANQNQSGIQAINVPGKGIQYVRFVNLPSSGGSTNTTKVLPAINTLSKISPSAQQKIVIQGKSGQQTYAVIQQPPSQAGQTKVVTMAGSKQILNKNVLQTFSTQKKILPTRRTDSTPVPTKLIAVVKKEDKNTNNAIDGTKKITSLTASQLSKLSGTSIIPGNNKNPPIVMLPSNYIQQLKKQQKTAEDTDLVVSDKLKSGGDSIEENESNELLKITSPGGRKPCNCTRSQCLKLYCDCFANGEFCSNCNCKECFNNLENEEERQKSIKLCLERNPNAFRPKIGKATKDQNESIRRHNKGCNCKRSGCLKNYCECYEAKIACSNNCKCFGCKNVEDGDERVKYEMSPTTQPARKRTAPPPEVEPPVSPSKQPYNFLTPDVIDATAQCLIAQAEECQKQDVDPVLAERMILEEFGRCLVEIIDFSIRNTDNK